MGTRLFDTLAVLVGRRRRSVFVALLAITVLLAAGATRLSFETSQDALIDSGTQVAVDNERFQDEFGGEPMLVLWTGDITKIFAGENLRELRALEQELRDSGRFPAVIGPVTALEFAIDQLTVAPGMLAGASERDAAAAADAAREEAAATGASATEQAAAAEQAAAEVAASYQAKLVTEMERLGEAGAQSLDNQAFLEFLLFEPDGQIRPILRDAFPDRQHVMMVVRLEGNADIAEQGPGSELVKELVADHPIDGFEVVATGPPTLLKEINDYLQGGMTTLGLMAAAVMALILFFVFRVRWRLLPLGVVAMATVWSFGAMGYLGIPLTMVTISGFPIILGLGVDFAIQMHNRFEEELGRGRTTGDAIRRTMRHMAPPLTIAAVAAIAGFLALQLSRVPMIRDFGLMLSIGMVSLIVMALLVPVSLLAMWNGRRPKLPEGPGHGLLERVVRRLVTMAHSWVVPVMVVGSVVMALGLAADGRFDIQTDPEKWVASDSDAVGELEALREGTKFSSELTVLIEADDVTSTEVVAWMERWSTEQLDEHPDELVRRTSVPAIAQSVIGTTPVQADVEAVLSVAPRDVVVSFVSADRTKANLIFPVYPISLTQREALIEEMTADLDPPPGVKATPSGLAVVGIELMRGLDANRQMMTVTALGLVLLWLLLVYRSLVRAVLPLIPVLFAVGASSVVVYVLGIELTPLTTVAGPLAIAVATEFSVLVMARYLEERACGCTPREAVLAGCVRIGRAFVASGLTLVGGFAVLALSPMPLLAEFGIVVAIIVVIALLVALTVMPALLVWVDEQRTVVPADADIDLRPHRHHRIHLRRNGHDRTKELTR